MTLGTRCRSLAFVVAACGAANAAFAIDPPPVAPVRPVTDTYFGTPVVDPYRYLENLKDAGSREPT